MLSLQVLDPDTQRALDSLLQKSDKKEAGETCRCVDLLLGLTGTNPEVRMYIAKSVSRFQVVTFGYYCLSSEYSSLSTPSQNCFFELVYEPQKTTTYILHSLPILLLSTDTIYPFYLPSFSPGGLLIVSKCLIYPPRLKIIDAIRRELCVFQAPC